MTYLVVAFTPFVEWFLGIPIKTFAIAGAITFAVSFAASLLIARFLALSREAYPEERGGVPPPYS